MPDVNIRIGGRDFEVACQDGEEPFLQAAAAMLDEEAQALSDALGRMPESRMLLMAGLMLADKTAGVEDKCRQLQEQVAALESQVASMGDQPSSEPERIEVPVVPGEVTEMLAELAARAEAVAGAIEEKTS